MGGQRLPARLCRRDHHRGEHRRALRAATGVRRRPRAVQPGLGGLRPGAQHNTPHSRPGHTGARGSDRDASQSHDPHHGVRARTPWPRDRDMGLHRRPCRGRRATRRRGVTQGLSWHWVFWVNVPVGLAGAALSRLRLPEAPASGAALDLVGAVSASLGALAVIWSLVESGGTNWDATNLGLMAGGLLVLAAFLAWERRAAAPMVPTRLFRDLQFSAANATAFFAYGAMFSAAFLMSQYFQMSLGYGPLATGLRFLPWTATPLFIAPLAGALSDKLGARPLMTLGLAMQAAGLAWVALLAGHTASYAEIVVPLVIAGVGTSMAIPTMPLAVMGAVAPPDMGTASGVLNMLQRFGGVVAVAVASAVFVSNGHLGTAVSFDNGFRPALLVSAGLSVLGSVSAILARRPRAKAVDLTGAGGQQEKTTAGAAAA